jgi:ABC-type transport system involved in multi-copper enzyme maturation permease subunit
MSTTAQHEAAGRAEHTDRGPGRPGRAPLRGLVWLVGRQHRAAFALLLAAVVGGVVYCVVLRAKMAGFIDAHHIAGCSEMSALAHCAGKEEAILSFRAAYSQPFQLAEYGLLSLPVLVGLFIGAPLLAREWEAGTHKLVLTQSVGPLRWLAAKTALPALAVAAATGVLAAVFSWTWQVGGDEVTGAYWYENSGFSALGPVPVAYALLALAIGVLTGLLLRRTVASMGVTLGATLVVQFVMPLLRPNLIASVMTKTGQNESGHRLPDTAWELEAGNYTHSGAVLPESACGTPGKDYEACLREHDVAGHFIQQHPVSHHWPLAWIETGILLALTALLTVIAFRVMRRRHG